MNHNRPVSSFLDGVEERVTEEERRPMVMIDFDGTAHRGGEELSEEELEEVRNDADGDEIRIVNFQPPGEAEGCS